MERVITAYIERQKGKYVTVYHKEDLPFGFFGEGYSVEEAVKDFECSYEGMKALYEKEAGMVFEDKIIFEYKHDTATLLEEVAPYINMAALAKETGINPVLLRRYKKGEYVSETQSERILKGINIICSKVIAASAK